MALKYACAHWQVVVFFAIFFGLWECCLWIKKYVYTHVYTRLSIRLRIRICDTHLYTCMFMRMSLTRVLPLSVCNAQHVTQIHSFLLLNLLIKACRMHSLGKKQGSYHRTYANISVERTRVRAHIHAHGHAREHMHPHIHMSVNSKYLSNLFNQMHVKDSDKNENIL
jgi:hypothetical protein